MVDQCLQSNCRAPMKIYFPPGTSTAWLSPGTFAQSPLAFANSNSDLGSFFCTGNCGVDRKSNITIDIFHFEK